MCGRTALSIDRERVCCACSYKDKKLNTFIQPEYLNEHNNGKEYTPSFNIAPTDVTPVLVSGNKFKNAVHTNRVLKPMMWGIIPPWHKGDYKNHNLSTNNCRIENIRSSKLYSPILINGGRCVIVAEGFYEWQTTTILYLYETKLKYQGLYHVWQNNNVVIYSYSIITMESNEILSWLHHRMPAILETEEQIDAWLDIDNVNVDMALNFLKPIKILEWHPVSKMVNNSKNKSADCNKMITDKDNTSQKSLTAWLTTSKRKLSDDGGQCFKTPKL